MKRKITYLSKDLHKLIALILLHSKDTKSQIELGRKKQMLFDEIDKITKKYDKIIETLQMETGLKDEA